MSEAIQFKRRTEKFWDWLATVIVAGLLAVSIACTIEGLVILLGMLLEDPAWNRSWVDQRLAVSIEWLEGVPLIGPLATLLSIPKDWLPANDYVRDLLALGLAFFPLMLVPGRQLGPTLIARYDDEALRPWPTGDFGLSWAGPTGDVQVCAWQRLHAWCYAGAGTGRSPFWCPWLMPDVSQRFSIAVLTGDSGVGKSHLAEALSRKLDGSVDLEACTSCLGALRFRLQVKLDNCQWWRSRQGSDPWDSGYLVEDPAARARLTGFSPRRATLIVADELSPQSLILAIEALNARRADFRHPVRLLIIDAVMPGSLGLRWDVDREVWATVVQELGNVPVIDMSTVRFGPPQFRRMVNAQVDATGERLQLFGKDSEWALFVEALDGLPVLLAESIRQVRDGRTSIDEMKRGGYTLESILEGQASRAIPLGPADLYGKARALMRERLLVDRAKYREQTIRVALGADVSGGEDAYFGLLIASLSGGAPTARLRTMLGWTVDKLGQARLSQIFGRGASSHWVPPIKPSVLADEMLRHYFHARHGAALPDEMRTDINRALRIAWLVNPAGTLRTVARWKERRNPDEFAQTMLSVPVFDGGGAEVELTGLRGSELRGQIAGCFFELAVFHGGDVAAAQEAMLALDDAALKRYAWLVDSLLERPDVCGLPALILWLSLEAQRWPKVGALNTPQMLIFGHALLKRADRLVCQVTLRSVWEIPLVPAFEYALGQLLPQISELAPVCASDAEFRHLVYRLDETLQRSQFTSSLWKIRGKMSSRLAASVSHHIEALSGEPAQWAEILMRCFSCMELKTLTGPVIRTWLAHREIRIASKCDLSQAWGESRLLVLITSSLLDTDPSTSAVLAERVAAIGREFPFHEGVQYECTRAWQDLALAHHDTDAVATATAVERVAAIGREFPRHEGIQHECAKALQVLAWAHSNMDAAATAATVERVAAIGREFLRHDGIQYECAKAWRHFTWTHIKKDVIVTATAAEQVAAIGREFPSHQGIQHECAQSWRYLSLAHHTSDAAATSAAAERVAAIGRKFPRHEGIQFDCAQAWRTLAWAHNNMDAAATAATAERVAAIGREFPLHEGIQHECAAAWEITASAHKDSDAEATATAAEQVAAIGRKFPLHEGIQHVCAQAWENLSWAHHSNPVATAAAVERVAAIGREFPRHEGIQFKCAQAWGNLSWAHKDSDAGATAAAAKRVAAIGHEFLRHEGIQHQCAQAWRVLAWVNSHSDASATETAVERVAAIGRVFPRHEGIQYDCAMAWQALSSAHTKSDPVATTAAAQQAATIGRKFPQHGPIQHECAKAWRYVVEAAVKADVPNLIDQGLTALDSLVGFNRGANLKINIAICPTSSEVYEERTRAYATYEAWRSSPPVT